MDKKDNSRKKKRIIYGIAFIVLLAVEIVIALFVHDSFIRPYLGDVLVVVVLYVAVRIVIPDQCRILPFYIFLFAAGVECLQYFHLVQLLGVEKNRFLRVLIGSVFDVKDILCYGTGCLMLGIYQRCLTITGRW